MKLGCIVDPGNKLGADCKNPLHTVSVQESTLELETAQRYIRISYRDVLPRTEIIAEP